MKTFYPKTKEIERQWWLVDAEKVILGRAATRIAGLLSGKHKPIYTPGVDTGDFVIVINAKKVRVTGKKEQDKLYQHHTGYVGNLKVVNLAAMRARKPEQVIRQAVKGMLPKGPLGRQMYRKLKVYAGPSHPHAAQRPQPAPGFATEE